ncbi:alpha/beta fold hydrolase [Devosia sp. ZB163]|uniref:alpha/beta fold hydrolase n=1 Tax=Devosia sp. ZB163 TaxID=3025938 RepID=UPI002360049B|nr:alpha/beta fold hydrolase [Devosia sp. ZB163]MDC9823643.1 alpha/beta fold hydrolase [Devosia sp. ZB163]
MPTFDHLITSRTATIRLSESTGAGLPLLLLHGSGASRQVFMHQFNNPLARAHRVIAPDLPGHGESSDALNPATDYSIPALARTVTEVLAARGIERFAIFGWSLGGHVGIELLATHPGVAGLMISGTPPISPGPLGLLRGFQTNLDLLLATKEQFTERDALRFYEMCYHGNGDGAFLEAIRRADGRVRPTVSRSLMFGEGADQRRAVEQAQVPVAIVNGEQESVARLNYVANLDYATLWTNTCHIIPNAGHAAFWDQPDMFNHLLTRFMADAAAFGSTGAVPYAKSA